MGRRPTDKELLRIGIGMTVNERLFAYGVLDDWYWAARRQDREKMIRILFQTGFTESQAIETTDALLRNPPYYGIEFINQEPFD